MCCCITLHLPDWGRIGIVEKEWMGVLLLHDDVIKWKHFPRYWSFVRGIHRSPVNSPHKGQWRGAFMFSLICAWINRWVNNREAGHLRRYRAHHDVIVMNCTETEMSSFWRNFRNRLHWNFLYNTFQCGKVLGGDCPTATPNTVLYHHKFSTAYWNIKHGDKIIRVTSKLFLVKEPKKLTGWLYILLYK